MSYIFQVVIKLWKTSVKFLSPISYEMGNNSSYINSSSGQLMSCLFSTLVVLVTGAKGQIHVPSGHVPSCPDSGRGVQ